MKKQNRTTRATNPTVLPKEARVPKGTKMIKFPWDSAKWNREALQSLYDVVSHLLTHGMVDRGARLRLAQHYQQRLGHMLDGYDGPEVMVVPAHIRNRVNKYDWFLHKA